MASATASFPIGGDARRFGSVAISAYNLFHVYADPFVQQEGGNPEVLINGKLGYTNGLNIGPTRVSFTYRRSFGGR